MDEKQQQLTFEKGITNVPSDAICSDNALEESLGMVYDNGEHRVIQQPKQFMYSVLITVLFVHEVANETHYIGYDTDKKVRWGKRNDNGKYEEGGYNSGDNICTYEGDVPPKIAAIGRTLIINVDSTTYYALWKDGKYLFLGDMLPNIEIKFSMTEAYSKMDHPQTETDLEDLIFVPLTVGVSSDDDNGTINSHEVKPGNRCTYWYHDMRHQDEFDTSLVGIVSAHLNDIKKIKRFCFPFWIRYALRLYDGSYTSISNPILMMPTVHRNCNAYFCMNNMDYWSPDDAGHEIIPVTYDPYSAKLKYQVTVGIGEGWDDIIEGVDIFVSEEIKTFDLEDHWRIINPFDSSRSSLTLLESIMPEDGSAKRINMLETNPDYNLNQHNYAPEATIEDKKGYTAYVQPKHWDEEEYKKRLLEANVFYKLFELEVDEIKAASAVTTEATSKIDSMTLVNLNTQTQLERDDYYSHTSMTANIIKTYNSRLHIADVSRSFFDGFGHFSNAINGTAKNYDIYVYIHTDDGGRVVKKEISSSNETFQYWLYYPDPRAHKIEIYDTEDHKCWKFLLKEHKALNGAYAYNGLPFSGDITPSSYTNLPSEMNDVEIIKNRMFVSEVNNPWVFYSEGDVLVGNTAITGLATQTAALGQEEHGIHPLTVFTDEGIYALKLNAEGVYIQPDIFSREICNNTKSIIETDGAVYFSSEKGLMVVVGSNVKCVSEQLSGKSNTSFKDFLSTAFIAYDYRDSLLWMFDGTNKKCWIYSIKSGTFAHYDFGDNNAITSVVNNYPDYLLQHDENIYTLLKRLDINHDDAAAPYTGTIITRPMKLENGLALKTIMQMMHIKQMEGALTFRMYASNNLDNWVELHSLRGTPWKYFKFQYDFSNMVATDRFAGTVLITQERRTNKLR